MSKDHIRLRYDGPALEGHYIDIDDLAPALLAVGNLCKLANQRFNGNRASVKVLVTADLEQGCFQIDLQLVLDIYKTAQMLVGHADIATAKEIFEWLGIIGGTALAPFGVMKLLKKLKGRRISKKELISKDGENVIQISIEGDNNTCLIHQETAELIEDPRILRAAQKILEPLSREGYEKLEFEHGPDEVESFSKDEAKEILAIDREIPLEVLDDETPQTITARVRVYSPVYEKDAKIWRFEYGTTHEYMDISETDIAAKALERGGALANDTYKVRLEITQTQMQSGNFKNHYKIVKVLEFYPARLLTQIDLFPSDEPKESPETE